MKTLQDYIIESIESDTINEGKIWDAIKKWWNGIFYRSTKKRYNRYASKMDVDLRNEYKAKLTEEFSINNLTIKKINPSSLNEIVRPNDELPNKKANIGFWDFIDEKIPTDNSFVIYGAVYESDNVTDTAALIKVKTTDNYTELLKLQIVNEFSQVLTLEKLMDFIFANTSEKEIIKNTKGIIIYKDTDKHLYEKLVNDCDFDKETLNSRNLAKRDK